MTEGTDEPIVVTVPQLGREDLTDMDARAIVEAQGRGQLEVIQGRPAPVDWPATLAAREADEPSELPQLSRDDLKAMSPEQIAKATADGRCDVLLGRK